MEEKEEEEEGCGGPRDGRVGTGSQGTGFGRKDPRAPAVPPEWHSELWNSVKRLQREQRRSCPWRLAPALPCPCPALPCPCPCPCPCPVPPLPCPALPSPCRKRCPLADLPAEGEKQEGKTLHTPVIRATARCPVTVLFSLFSFLLGPHEQKGPPESPGGRPEGARLFITFQAVGSLERHWSTSFAVPLLTDSTPGPSCQTETRLQAGPPVPGRGCCASVLWAPSLSGSLRFLQGPPRLFKRLIIRATGPSAPLLCSVPQSRIFKKSHDGDSVVAQQKQIRSASVRWQVRSPASLRGLRTRRCRELRWRPAAVAPIQPLAWEPPPYAEGAALKNKKKIFKAKNTKTHK